MPEPTLPEPDALPRGHAVVSDEQAVALATALVRPLLEVLEGRRPLRQLHGMLAAGAMYRLELTLRRGDRLRDGHMRDSRMRDSRMRDRGLRLHKVRTCLPRPGVIEACAVVQAGPRFRAIALRLEHRRRWVCTALRLG